MTVTIPAPAQPLHWLGGQIDVRVEIDTGGGEGLGFLWDEGRWDEGRWGSTDPVWVDMTHFDGRPLVLSVDLDEGAERWGERFRAGIGTIIVDNTSGIFTPDSGVPDPWFREYRPGRLIRVVAIPDPDTGIKVPLFTGRLDASKDMIHANDIEAVLTAVDFMGDWANFNPLAGTATGAQSTDERIHAALDRYEWPAADRDIQEGVHNVQSSDLAQSTLEEAQRAADAEGGAFFASKDGHAVFKARDWLTTDTRSTTVQGYVGYDEVPAGAQAAHLADPETSWELARVFNDIRWSRVGGTMQTAADVGSQTQHGIRTSPRTDLQNVTDGEVLTLAVRALNSFRESRLRVDAVTIGAVADPDNEDLNRLLWATELGDRLAVLIDTGRGWSIERETHVMGIHHTITGADWTTRMRLDDAQAIELEYWKLEDPILGVLGETTRLL